MTDRYGRGIYADIPHEDYHADPAPEPSFTAGIANLLLTRSPAHARWHHRRLNPGLPPPDHNHRMNDGAILHELLLGTGAGIVEIDADDFKTKAAREARDAAMEAGKTPVCGPKLAELRGIVAAVWDQLDGHEMFRGLPPGSGIPEATMIWPEAEAWCRARADWLASEMPLIADFKFSARGALAWASAVAERGDDVRAAHYLAGLHALRPSNRDYRYLFVVIETDPPHGLCVHELDAEALNVGERKREHALAMWRTCMRDGRWPGYREEVNRVSLKPYHIADWNAREELEDVA